MLQRTPGTFLVSSKLRGPAPHNTALGFNRMTDLFARASTVTDERSFVAFLAELAKDRAASMRAEAASPSSPTGPTSRGWENVELSSFLEAAASWAEATASGTRAYHPPSNPWQRAAQIICAGKFYE